MRPLRGPRFIATGVAAIVLASLAIQALVHHLYFFVPQLTVLSIFVVVAIFERRRYRALTAAADSPNATSTGERFRDPVSGRLTDVYYDASTGLRSYRTES